MHLLPIPDSSLRFVEVHEQGVNGPCLMDAVMRDAGLGWNLWNFKQGICEGKTGKLQSRLFVFASHCSLSVPWLHRFSVNVNSVWLEFCESLRFPGGQRGEPEGIQLLRYSDCSWFHSSLQWNYLRCLDRRNHSCIHSSQLYYHACFGMSAMWGPCACLDIMKQVYCILCTYV